MIEGVAQIAAGLPDRLQRRQRFLQLAVGEDEIVVPVIDDDAGRHSLEHVGELLARLVGFDFTPLHLGDVEQEAGDVVLAARRAHPVLAHDPGPCRRRRIPDPPRIRRLRPSTALAAPKRRSAAASSGEKKSRSLLPTIASGSRPNMLEKARFAMTKFRSLSLTKIGIADAVDHRLGELRASPARRPARPRAASSR